MTALDKLCALLLDNNTCNRTEDVLKRVSGLRIRVRIAVDVTVEWGFTGLISSVIALAYAIASVLTCAKESAMTFINLVCVGAALMPAWLESPISK